MLAPLNIKEGLKFGAAIKNLIMGPTITNSWNGFKLVLQQMIFTSGPTNYFAKKEKKH